VIDLARQSVGLVAIAESAIAVSAGTHPAPDLRRWAPSVVDSDPAPTAIPRARRPARATLPPRRPAGGRTLGRTRPRVPGGSMVRFFLGTSHIRKNANQNWLERGRGKA